MSLYKKLEESMPNCRCSQCENIVDYFQSVCDDYENCLNEKTLLEQLLTINAQQFDEIKPLYLKLQEFDVQRADIALSWNEASRQGEDSSRLEAIRQTLRVANVGYNNTLEDIAAMMYKFHQKE
jgi:hypothetical protein